MECIFPKRHVIFGKEARAANVISTEISLAVFQFFESLLIDEIPVRELIPVQMYNTVKSVDEHFPGP